MLNTVWRDFRYAARGLGQSPAFTLTAALTVALGIAGPSLVFSLANWTLLRPVPGVADPVRVGAIVSAQFSETSYSPRWIEHADYVELRRSLKTLDLAGHQGTSVVVSTPERPARTVPTEFVTASYLRVLGIRMLLGRVFTDAEDVPGAPVLTAVISERAWDALFARAPDVLTRTITINGHPFSIVGVTANGFGGTLRTSANDLWLPGATSTLVNRLRPRPGAPSAHRYYTFVGRLRDEATWPQAESELQAIAAWLMTRDSTRYANFKTATVRLDGPIGHSAFFQDRTVTYLSLMLAGTAILLLIACSNVATMTLVRQSSRQSEIAVRRALGGGTWDLIRQRLAEGTLIWVMGGAIALLIVLATIRVVDGLTLLGERGQGASVPIDWRLVAFTAVLALIAGVISSLAPALATARIDPAEALQATAATHTTRNRLATASTGIQLAASLALLVGALLLTASVRNLSSVDLGFDPERTHYVSVNLRPAGYVGAPAVEFIRQFVAHVAAAPGVDHVAAAQQVPIAAAVSTTFIKPPDDPTRKIPAREMAIVSGRYFETLGIPIVKGRRFEERDFAGDNTPVILSQRLAREIFGTLDPVGRTIEYWTIDRRGRPFEVIGVAADIQLASVEGEPEMAVYQTANSDFVDGAHIVVRMATRGDPTSMLEAAAAALDRNVPIERVQPLEAAIDARRRPWLVLTRLMVVVAGVAVLLSGVGLGAIVSAGIASRIREIGIRIALGATPQRIGRYTLRRTLYVTAGALLVGSAGAAALAQFLRGRLFGVGPFEPGPWALAVAGLLLISLAASWMPVRRAIRLDVARTLRV